MDRTSVSNIPRRQILCVPLSRLRSGLKGEDGQVRLGFTSRADWISRYVQQGEDLRCRVLEGCHQARSCYASITFTYDGEEDSSESTAETVSDTQEYVSDVLLGRCVLATKACRELGFLLETETIPSGTRWDNVRSLLLGAYTKQGAGVSKYTTPKSHWLPALHALARTRPQSITSKVKMEYTSIQVNKVGSLDVHQDKFNCGCNWIISMGKYKGRRLWIESPGGRLPTYQSRDLSGAEYRQPHFCRGLRPDKIAFP
eukprot:4972374-Amphidinium_carterae.1